MSDTKKNKFYILVAASAVGKSALMRQMINEHIWISVPKYSTRDVRCKDGELDDVVGIDQYKIGEMSEVDGAKVRLERITRLKEICGGSQGVVYYKNGNFYGIRIEDVEDKLRYGNAVAIISDFHVIKALKDDRRLTGRVKVLYIASTIDERELLKRFKKREAVRFDTDSESKRMAIKNIQSLCSVLGSATRLNYMDRIEEVMPLLNEEWNNILPYFETIKTRGANIRMLYNQYIDNIALIDYAILNFYGLDYMYAQVRNIVRNGADGKKAKYPPVFMVCAAPSSGKATLMEIVGDLGEVNGNIRITQKYARREPREGTDGRDGMIAIGKSGHFEEHIKTEEAVWKWSFHKSGEQSKGTEYAVDKAEISRNIKSGVAQIFISNMEQIAVARKYYPDNMVVLYLHATHETETKNHIVTKCRLDMMRSICNDQGCSDEESEAVLQNSAFYQRKLKEDIAARLAEIRAVHDDFLRYNHLIDHVLLNTGTREDLVAQMTNLINFYK